MPTIFKKLVFILTIAIGALYIKLAQSFTLFGKTFRRYDLGFSIGNFQVARKFDLKLGLDLAGGSHLVFDADVSKLSDDKKARRLWVYATLSKKSKSFEYRNPQFKPQILMVKTELLLNSGIKDKRGN